MGTQKISESAERNCKNDKTMENDSLWNIHVMISEFSQVVTIFSLCSYFHRQLQCRSSPIIINAVQYRERSVPEQGDLRRDFQAHDECVWYNGLEMQEELV